MLRTTVVGSYPVPDWLKAHPTEQALTDAMAVVLRNHEEAGIDVICDGELGRWDLQRNRPGGMVERFVSAMEGVQAEPTYAQRHAYRQRSETSYRAQVPAVVVDQLKAGHLDLPGQWLRAKRLSTHPQKFTVTSPYMLAKVVLDEFYHDLAKLALAMADVLAEQLGEIDAAVLQVDEPNLPGTPQDGPLAAEAINRLLDASACREKAVHLCFGNYGGQTIQQGDYRKLVEFLNALRCDHLVLETTRRPQEELVALREVSTALKLGIGVIDIKDLQVETPEEVARRIDALAEIVGAERLQYVHPDCGMQHLPREIADAKLRSLVAGRDLYVGAK